jgi:hypothetical protein
VRELGLQHGINYKQRDYVEAIKDLTQGEGVDAVFEMLGGEHVAKSVKCVRDFGRVIVYGAATGETPRLDTRVLYAKGASVHGLWLVVSEREPPAHGNRMEAAFRMAGSGPAPSRDRRKSFPLEQAREAYTLMQEGKNYGKIVLKIEAQCPADTGSVFCLRNEGPPLAACSPTIDRTFRPCCQSNARAALLTRPIAERPICMLARTAGCDRSQEQSKKPGTNSERGSYPVGEPTNVDEQGLIH